ncbi:MAG: restriction endonuclease [Proteobacteria bacterium]|nr:restriction endonuclease [Pseudomonadota bacterium]
MSTDNRVKSRLIYEAAQELGWSDPAAIAKFVRRLERGLPAEDELSVIFHWLGQCRLVHKIDQLPYPPGVLKDYRIPDLLAVFEVENTRVPVLIEVKKSTKRTLSWRPDFLGALKRYSALVDLPLLVAWKHQSFWTLFEARHLKKAVKNYNITFEMAMKENLLGLLAGDFSFSFRPGAGIHMKIRKLQARDHGFDGVIEEAYYLNAKGERHTTVYGLMQLFLCIEQDVSIHEDENHVLQSFVVQTSEQMVFAHRALVTILSTFQKDRGPIRWHRLLKKDSSSSLAISPHRAAHSALAAGFIQYIINQQPVSAPTFLDSSLQKSSEPNDSSLREAAKRKGSGRADGQDGS